MLIGLLLLSLLIVIIFGPQLWSQQIMKKYSKPLNDIPGTGGQFVQHLLNRFEVSGVTIEAGSEYGDHYDPEKKNVCLSPANYEGKSLTAVVVAAHEFGHVLQHKSDYSLFFLRWRLAKFVQYSEKIASFILIVFPFAAILTRMPLVGVFMLITGLGIMFLPVLVHLITLPVEIDASFNRALPILEKGEYLPEGAIPVARKILTAASLTYLAASLASLLNFYRWIAILRR